jgi:hypothetical protein
LAKLAIENGADVNYLDRDIILIIYAINMAYWCYNHDFKISYLILENNINARVRDINNCSLLYGAVKYKDVRLVRFLCSRYKLDPFDQTNAFNLSPLSLAIKLKFYDGIIEMTKIMNHGMKQIYLNFLLLKYVEDRNVGGIDKAKNLGAKPRQPFLNGLSVYDMIYLKGDAYDMLQYI